MKLSIGIIGLPNVGKSTLFNALLEKKVADVSNYPFCTIHPNVGVVEVPDERLYQVAKIAQAKEIIPAAVEFVDIAGLVKGAHKGEGLGNQFLAHIRETQAICHVVRFFEDENVPHIHKEIDPLNDIAVVETELILADLQTLEKHEHLKKKGTKETQAEKEVIDYLKENLNQGIALRKLKLNSEQEAAVKELALLTIKPIIYVANVSENQLAKDLFKEPELAKFQFVIIPAKLEVELQGLSEEEKQQYLNGLGIKESGLEQLIKKSYETLGLISFFTTESQIIRAWTIKRGTNAQKAAGVIHGDFEKKFIKAEVVNYDDFVSLGGWQKAKEAGRVRLEGREYEVKDGEVIRFRVGT